MDPRVCPNCQKIATNRFLKAYGLATGVLCKECGSILKYNGKNMLTSTIWGTIITLILWKIFLVNLLFCLGIVFIYIGYKQYKEPFVLVYANNS